jgi:perosamine synthetase
MRVQRTIPPTAPPVKSVDLFDGLAGLLSNRQCLKSLEGELRKSFEVPHVFCVSSGKAALVLILLALRELSNRNQVVIPAYTCFSVPSSIARAALEIVPCDVDPITFDFDYDSLQTKVTNQTLCVIATHLFGIPADLDRLRKLCAEKGVFIVEDAAQAIGGEYKGRKLGTIGDVGFYSLDRGKNITCGSGGIIVARNEQIGTALRGQYRSLEETPFADDLKNLLQLCLMSLFIRPWLYWLPAGMPFLKLGQTFFHRDFPILRLSARRAALLQRWRERLVESNRRRAETATAFCQVLSRQDRERKCIPYLRFPILVKDRKTRDQIYARSKERGLGLSLMYPMAIDEIGEIKGSFHGEVFPRAKQIAETLVTLPTHQWLSEADKKTICDVFTDAVSGDILAVPTSVSEAV